MAMVAGMEPLVLGLEDELGLGDGEKPALSLLYLGHTMGLSQEQLRVAQAAVMRTPDRADPVTSVNQLPVVAGFNALLSHLIAGLGVDPAAVTEVLSRVIDAWTAVKHRFGEVFRVDDVIGTEVFSQKMMTKKVNGVKATLAKSSAHLKCLNDPSLFTTLQKALYGALKRRTYAVGTGTVAKDSLPFAPIL